MTPLATDAGLLWQVVWVSLVAGVGVCALFSLVILTGARAAEARRGGRDGAAAVLGALAALVLLVFLVGVVLGVQVMLTK